MPLSPIRVLLVSSLWIAVSIPCPAEINSIGIELVDIPAGSFRRGSERGKWDERPVREVTLSRPFRISRLEVTRTQWLRFRPDWESSSKAKAIGVTWDDAVAFCAWLSRKEGRPYRLPTEAEWEYACRRDGMGDDGRLVGMLDDVVEWCQDWYGVYPDADLTDPVGPDGGLARVLRGDKVDVDNRVILPCGYNRPANRSGMPADYGLPYVETNVSFRVVQAPAPETRPSPRERKFFGEGVKQTTAEAARRGPDPSRPYFRKRYLLPTPPETWEGNVYEDDSHRRWMERIGLHPGFGGHQHSAALEVLPNGDLLFVAYTSWTEYSPEVGLLAARLRFGEDEWDFPDFAFDLPGANDHAPLLWTDGSKTHLFWGSPKLMEHPPFQWITTGDSGATWSAVHYPSFATAPGRSDAQPINSAFRDAAGTVYVAADGPASDSILWASDDSMATWRDPGGRTGGGHTTFALLADGRTILGMNSRKGQIGYHMTASLSADGARSFSTLQTPFSWGGSNQRSSLLRLQSGRLLFATDAHNSVDPSPPEWRDRDGAILAVSEDEGKTWRMKLLPGAQRHETRAMTTIGYSVLRQGADGLIHLVTTMNRPCLHFTFNEAWLLSDAAISADDAALRSNSAHVVSGIEIHEERYPDGRRRLSWSAGRGDDGRYLLQGPERWYYPDGALEYEAVFERGEKVGAESWYAPDGSKTWEWNHRPGRAATWTQFRPDGSVRAKSQWSDMRATDPVQND